MEAAGRNGTLIPLDGLAGKFPTTAEGFFLAYAESVSAVDFLVRTHGEDALVSLIRSYADGRTDDEAFPDALGVDTAGFDDAWLADLGVEAPAVHGPQPAPEGPLPEAWGGPAVQPGGATDDPGAAPTGGATDPGRTDDPAHPRRPDRPWWRLVVRSVAHRGRGRGARGRCPGLVPARRDARSRRDRLAPDDASA